MAGRERIRLENLIIVVGAEGVLSLWCARAVTLVVNQGLFFVVQYIFWFIKAAQDTPQFAVGSFILSGVVWPGKLRARK